MDKRRNKTRKRCQPEKDDELRPSYDSATLDGGEFGKFYDEYRTRHVVRLEPDVAAEFSDEKAVNDALRLIKQLRDLDRSRVKETA